MKAIASTLAILALAATLNAAEGDAKKPEGDKGKPKMNPEQVFAKKDADKEKIGWLSTDPRKLQERFGGRWLSTDFKAGDMLCFTMHTLHGALDNNSPIKRCRLTSDTRYQPASEPIDERWNGANPEAHGYDKVFLPGLGAWNNQEFQDEWKKVDELGRLLLVR